MKKNYLSSKFQNITVVFIAFTLLFIISCEKDETDLNTEELSLKCAKSKKCKKNKHCDKLVSYDLIASYTVEQLKLILDPNFHYLINYDVDLYKVVYKSVYKGKRIEVSGAIGIPQTETEILPKILVYNHGTRLSEADRMPSLGDDIISVLTAANGHISFAADYIGFVESDEYFHPYLVNSASTPVICDMIIAGKQALNKLDINHSKGVYMFGFSQGALVTLAAQKEIENNHMYWKKIKLNAIATATGPYDLHDHALLPIMNMNNYTAPAFLVFAFTAYNIHYHLGFDLDVIFNNSYGQLFLDMLAQNKGYNDINPLLPQQPTDLFNQNFFNKFLSGNTPFNYLFEKNSIIHGWVPRSPLKIFHSPNDEIVPYENAEVAYNTFVSHGAVSVELITLPPVDHVTSAFLSYAEILAWFESL